MKIFRAVLAASILAMPYQAFAEDEPTRLGGGQIAFQYVGRVTLDFLRGTGTVYGYVTQLAGVPSSALFKGSPGEATALVTFRADVSFQPLPGNGEMGPNQFAVFPGLVAPGPFKLYLTENPSRTWTDPAGFSSGATIAEFTRADEMFTLFGSIGLNTASASLASSTAINLNGISWNARRIIPRGITNITTANGTPLPGSTPVSPAFAFAGYALAIGR